MTSTDQWWASLTVGQKERIASKAKQKANPEAAYVIVRYPACSAWWITLDEAHKLAIHDHCTDKHGYLLPDWSEGKTLSY